VFSTVEDFLGPDERAHLAAAFAQFEMMEGGQGTTAKYGDLIAALERETRGWD
jgi:hypothetical protein